MCGLMIGGNLRAAKSSLQFRQGKKSSLGFVLTGRVLRNALRGVMSQDGIDGYLAKPMRRPSLRAEMARVLIQELPEEKEIMKKLPETRNQPVVNFSELFERAEKDRELLRDLLGIFKEDFPRYCASLKEGVVRQDAKEVERVAHTLRGMLSNMAAARAAAAVGRLESAARGGDQAGLMEGFARFEKEISGLMPELESYLEEARR